MSGVNQKVLISGGTGFLGSHITRMLLYEGYELLILKRESSSLKRLSDIADKLKFLDISENLKADLKELKFDYFFNLATCYGKNQETDDEILYVNYRLPFNILNYMSASPVLINFGTSLPSELNIYAKSKNLFVEEVKRTFPEGNLINLKLEHFFGPGDGKFISYLVEKMKEDNCSIDLTKGEQVRDFIYYKDVLKAVLLLLKNDKNNLGDISLGTQAPLEIKEVVLTIYDMISPQNVHLNWGAHNYREGELMYSSADISFLKELGFSPDYNFRQGLEDFLL